MQLRSGSFNHSDILEMSTTLQSVTRFLRSTSGGTKTDVADKRPVAAPRRRFAFDVRGAVAVEFALIMVPFLALLLMIFLSGYLLLVRSYAQEAAFKIGRYIQAGLADANSPSNGATLCAKALVDSSQTTILPSFLSCNSMVVNVQSASGATSASLNTSGMVVDDTYLTSPNFDYGASYSAGTNVCYPATVWVQVWYPVPAALFPIVVLLSSAGGLQMANSSAGIITLNGTKVYLVRGSYILVKQVANNGDNSPQTSCT
jgi:Flp pilus assembly protein TadG